MGRLTGRSDRVETVNPLGTLPQPMADWLAARVRASPDATALIDAGSEARLTYGDLDERATRVAAGLAAHGIGAGDRVGSVLGVGPAAVSFVHAVSRLGAVLVPLSPRLTAGEIGARTRRADCKVLVHDGSADVEASTIDGTVRLVALDALDTSEESSAKERGGTTAETGNERNSESSIGETPANGTSTNGVSTGFDDPLVLLFTSGTTGRPKAVVLTVGNVLASAGASAVRLGVLPGDRWLLALSTGSMGGLAPIYRAVLYGTTLVLQRGFDARRTIGALSTYDCTGISLVPTMLSRVLNVVEPDEEGGRECGSDDGDRKEYDGEGEYEGGFPASVRCVLLGGAPASRELVERCRAGDVPVHPTYGMTETASQVATARPDEAFSNPGTVGRPLVGTTVVAVEDGSVLDPGERGELVVNGPTVTPGYYDDREATDEAFSGHGFHTGDLGYVDDDGRVWVTGRLDDRIVTGGQTVDPEEVSRALREHPAVHEAAVAGLDDAEWGERIGALVVPGGPGTAETSERGVSEGDLDAHCRERLAGYKLPRTIAVAHELPRTESGTIDRNAVKARLRATDAG